MRSSDCNACFTWTFNETSDNHAIPESSPLSPHPQWYLCPMLRAPSRDISSVVTGMHLHFCQPFDFGAWTTGWGDLPFHLFPCVAAGRTCAWITCKGVSIILFYLRGHQFNKEADNQFYATYVFRRQSRFHLQQYWTTLWLTQMKLLLVFRS